jgi:hypothetical protein
MGSCSTAPRLTLVLLSLLARWGDCQWVPSETASTGASSSLKAVTATLPERTFSDLKFLEHKADSRDLQSFSSKATYWVNYTAQFQVIQDSGCTVPPPAIVLFCAGSDNIEVHKTSNPSIVCGTPGNIRGFSYVDCTNTCSSKAACRKIYLNVDQAVSDGPFGTIDFSCTGSSLRDVRGYMEIVESSVPARCTASSRFPTRVFSIARLGVSCPPLNDKGKIAAGSSAATTTRSVVYDDFYFECIPSQSFPLSDTDNSYTCYDGLNCAEACNVNLTSLYVAADVPNFQDTCGQTTLTDPISAATIPPVTTTGKTYTARFEASWSLQFTPGSETSCRGRTPTVAIVCYNSKIRFIGSTYASMNCTATGADSLSCFTGAAKVGVNQFVDLTYVSTIADTFGNLVTHLLAVAGLIHDPCLLFPSLVCRNALDRTSPRPVSDSHRAPPRAMATRWKLPSATRCS